VTASVKRICKTSPKISQTFQIRTKLNISCEGSFFKKISSIFLCWAKKLVVFMEHLGQFYLKYFWSHWCHINRHTRRGLIETTYIYYIPCYLEYLIVIHVSVSCLYFFKATTLYICMPWRDLISWSPISAVRDKDRIMFVLVISEVSQSLNWSSLIFLIDQIWQDSPACIFTLTRRPSCVISIQVFTMKKIIIKVEFGIEEMLHVLIYIHWYILIKAH
jgi:hypothetical protein